MNTDTLSATFQALADPTRRAILQRLAKGDAPVGELAKPFAMSLPAISKHLKVLEGAALIERHKDAQWRRCKLNARGMRAAAGWIDQYRKFWEASFDNLAAFLENTDKENDHGTSSEKRTKRVTPTRRG